MLLDFESQCFITRWENIKRGNLAGVVQLKVTAWKIKFKNQLSKNNNLELFWNFCFVGYNCFQKTVDSLEILWDQSTQCGSNNHSNSITESQPWQCWSSFRFSWKVCDNHLRPCSKIHKIWNYLKINNL